MGLFIVIIWGCFRNYLRAKLGNLNAGFWAFMTFLSVLIAWFIGAMMVIVMMIIKDPAFKEMLSESSPDQQAILDYMTQKNLFISEIFIFVCALGGYLFVRYLIMKKVVMPDSDDDAGLGNQ